LPKLKRTDGPNKLISIHASYLEYRKIEQENKLNENHRAHSTPETNDYRMTSQKYIYLVDNNPDKPYFDTGSTYKLWGMPTRIKHTNTDSSLKCTHQPQMPRTTTNSNVLYEYQAYDNFQLL
jgi:hypothetical protein